MRQNPRMRPVIACIVVHCVALCAAAPAAAQTFPVRAVRIIVPYAPGGGSDNLSRLYAPRLSQALGQQVVVDNRPGGGARIGTELAARAAPDGHTLLKVDTAFLANPALYAKLPYDTVRDFAPVTLVANGRAILVVHPSLPVKTLRDLIVLAKAHPGQINYSSPGHGTGGHLTSELFSLAAGIRLAHIPYKGAGPAVADVIGGQITITFAGVSTTKGFIDQGRLRPLAVTGDRRAPSLPQVPTFTEAGLPAVNYNSHWGLVAPAGTPGDVISRLNAEVNVVMNLPEVKDRLKKQGIDPEPGTQAQLLAHVKSEITRFAALIKAIGLQKLD